MKKLLIPILLFLCLSIANAQTFNVGDFKYTVLSGNDVNVAKADEAVLQGELTIPETVNYEGKDYTVTTIAAYGFQETDITSLNLPNSISKIGKYAFYNCQELKNADIPESLTKIENWIFIECSNLERLTISKNVKEVGYGFVSACHQLREIIVDEENPALKAENGMLLSKDGSKLYAYAYGLEAEQLVIPETVTWLNTELFQHNKRLKSVVIPSGVTALNGDTFRGCTTLEEVEMPDGIIKFSYTEFIFCESLQSVTIPAKLSNLPYRTFHGCNAIKSVTARQYNPIEVENDPFPSTVYANATLYVPIGRKAEFEEANGWKKFRKIEEVELPGVEMSSSPYDNIADNQMILGYYRSNQYEQDEENGYGGYNAGLYRICVGYDKDKIRPFVGNAIKNIRFALLNTAIKDVKIWIGSTRDKSDLLSQSVEQITTGWNEVMLDAPYMITGEEIYIGIEYKQGNANYPMSTVNEGAEVGSAYLYGPYDNGNGLWLDYNDRSASIQCIIEGDHIPLYDLRAVKAILFTKYQKAGETTSGFLYLRNWGKNRIENFEITVNADGKKTTQNCGAALQWGKTTEHGFSFDIAGDASVGKHQIQVGISSIHGETPLFNEDDYKTLNLNVYSTAFDRQKLLLDLYTATWCRYCPRADRWVERLKKERDDITLVSSHYSDHFSCEASEAYCMFTSYFPNYFFDRYASTGASELTYTYPDNAKIQPSFANVNIEGTYDESTKTATIKVYGQKSEEFDLLIGSANLTVLLTEDQIVAGQADAENGYQENFVHQGVLRTNVSAIWGDPVAWNGDRYEKTYIVKLDDSWVKDNMNVVAFLGKPFTGDNYDELHVVNCNDFALKDATPTHGGDANGDGTTNATDIVEVVNYIMGNPSAIFDESSADLNGDGVVNAADIVEMVNIIMAAK